MTWVAPITILIGFRARILNKISNLGSDTRSLPEFSSAPFWLRTISERLVASLEYRKRARLVAV